MGEETARAAIAALNFVQDEQSAGFGAQLAEAAQEVVVDHTDAGHALDALDDDGGEAARVQERGGGFEVVERSELHMVGAVEGGAYGGIVRGGHGSGRAAVESAVKGQDGGAAGGKRGQLHGVLVGLGA